MAFDPARVEAVFGEAVALRADQRPAYLDRTCAQEAELRERIEALLSAHDSAGSFLGLPGGAPAAGPLPAEGCPSVIGRYKLLEQIGEGGFGTVFMAEQREPVRRKVAIKIIKLGMDTKQIIARFEAERQALAMMDHPSIAKVLDGGTTETGRPYFVMELVQGMPITKFCDENKLTTRQRLELFIPVCAALQHAHQKGIIHRDLKPGNVLVTMHDGTPVPKIIDFGVAKAINQRLTEHTLFTEFRQLIGTPAYMSPEQAQVSGLDVDTRSDIYSLGVLLYELLTGATPFDAGELRGAAYAQMQRMIQEAEPPPPSTRVSTLAAAALSALANRRQCDARTLGRTLKGDLDWIVMRCLEKDRSRRYETAAGLARDVQRFLRSEPVEASPPSTVYRVRKLVHKHKREAIALSSVLAVLLTAAILSYVRIAKARSDALIAQQSEARQRVIADQRRVIAEAAEKDALEARRTAEMRLAESLIAQGQAMGAASRWVEAKELYRKAGQTLRANGRSRQTADLALVDAYRNAPPPLMIMASDGGRIDSTAISADGRLGASGCSDSTIRLWDLQKGIPLRVLRGSELKVKCILFSADGARVYSAGDDGWLRWWSTSGGRLLGRLGQMGPIVSFTLSANEKRVAICAEVNGSAVWDLATARPLCPLPVDAWGSNPAFVPGPEPRCVMSGGPWLNVFDVGSSHRLAHFEDPFDIASVAVSPDARYLMIGRLAPRVPNLGQAIAIRDLKTWKVVRELHGHTSDVYRVEFSSDQKRAYSASLDGTVKVWDTATGREIRTIWGDSVHLDKVSFCVKSGLALSGGADGILRLWDLHGDRGQRTLKGGDLPYPRGEHASCADLSSNGRMVLSASTTKVSLWDVATGQCLQSVPAASLPSHICCVALSPDGRHGLWTIEIQPSHLYDFQTHKDMLLPGAYQAPRTAAFSPNGALALAGGGCDLGVFQTATAKPITLLHPPFTLMRQPEFSRDGRFLLGATSHGVSWTCDLNTLVQPPIPRAYEAETRELTSNAEFAPDRSRVLAAADTRLLLWDASTGRLLHSFDGNRSPITHVALLDGGKYAVTGDLVGSIKLWDLAQMEEACVFQAHAGAIGALRCTPDGLAMVSAGYGGSIRVWDLSRTAEYRDFGKRLEQARIALAAHSDDPAALRVLGEWYAFRGQWAWATDLLVQARRLSQKVSPLLLARCYWQTGHVREALTEFAAAKAEGDAPVFYIDQCMRAAGAALP